MKPLRLNVTARMNDERYVCKDSEKNRFDRLKSIPIVSRKSQRKTILKIKTFPVLFLQLN